jgi:Tfp pilus assembly protein PilF
MNNSRTVVEDFGSRRKAQSGQPVSSLNNNYGVGLGFRCAKTAPLEIEQQIRTATSLPWWKWAENG